MRIRDFRGNYDVRSMAELESVLEKRYFDDENWFLLCLGGEKEACMTLAVKGDLATLHYMRNTEDAGFISIGGVLDRAKDVTFRMSERSDFQVRGDAVMPMSKAVSAAKEFFASKDLPTSVEWLEI
jgi:hypothetical protein